MDNNVLKKNNDIVFIELIVRGEKYITFNNFLVEVKLFDDFNKFYCF